MVEKLKVFVKRLENSRISFCGFLITFLSVVFLRNFLETFSDRDNFWTPVSSPAYFIHYPLFYLSLLLGLAILLHWLTREKIVRVTKIVLFFFPLILLAPTCDLLLSGGEGYNMSYLFGDLPYLIKRFVTFFWGYSGKGVTPGMQIEMVTALSLVGGYVFLKTGKVGPAIGGIIASYSVGFVMGSLPSVMAILWNLAGSAIEPQELFAADVVLYHFYSFNHKMALVFLPIVIGELGLWFWLYNKRASWALVGNLRGLRVLHYVCMLGFGMILGYARLRPVALFDSPFPVLIVITSVFSGVLAWWYAVGLNDLHDLKTDRIANRHRPLASGTVNDEEQRAVNLTFLLFSLVSAYLVRYPFFVPILLTVGLSYIYSAPPFRLKRVPFLATFIIALCSGLVCLGGFALFSDNYSYSGFPPRVLLAILVGVTIAFTVKDIKDLNGDRVTGTVTLPILLGEKMGKRVIGILALLGYLSVPLIFECFMLLPLAILFGILTCVLINRARMRETPVFMSYFLFLGILLYSLSNEIQNGSGHLFG